MLSVISWLGQTQLIRYMDVPFTFGGYVVKTDTKKAYVSKRFDNMITILGSIVNVIEGPYMTIYRMSKRIFTLIMKKVFI